MTEDEAGAYRKMGPEAIYGMIKTYDSRIASNRKRLWSQGKTVSGNERETRRAGWTAYRNSGLFTGPGMNAVRTSVKVTGQKKKELEDL